MSVVIFLLGLMACGVQRPIDMQAGDTSVSSYVLQSEKVKLSPPQFLIDSFLFESSARTTMELREDGTILNYTLGNNEWKRYDGPIAITESGKLIAVARHPDYKESDTVRQDFVKVNRLLQSATITSSHEPNDSYPGNGLQSLMDHNKGTLDFKQDNLWCGFNQDIIRFNLSLDSAKSIQKIYLSILTDEKSWIFSPAKIKIELNQGEQIEHLCDLTQKDEKARLSIIPISINSQAVQTLSIEIQNLLEIPEWHPGAGTKPWFFIDEIIVE
jgi:hypothetical protein